MTPRQLARSQITPYHIKLLQALDVHRLTFYEWMAECDLAVGLEDNEFREMVVTLVNAGYVTGTGVYEATGVVPPRTIDDEWTW